MGERKLDNYTVEEYLDLEESTGERFEYFDGLVYALAGGSLNHTIISSNIHGELRQLLKGKNCVALTSEAKICIANSFVYPDATVVCGGIKTHEKDNSTLLNPTLIVEVLSPSSKKNDMGDKFFRYRMLASFREYVVIHQDSPIVETFYKDDNGKWNIETYLGLKGSVQLLSIGIGIELEEIYRHVENLQAPQVKIKFNT